MARHVNTTRMVALMTLERGTPQKPDTVERDREFDCPDEEVGELVGRGFARRAGNDGEPPLPIVE